MDSVLWSYQTTSHVPTDETPFKLTFEAKIVIPLEIGIVSDRIKKYDENTNQVRLQTSLDFLKEVREKAQIGMAALNRRSPNITTLESKQKFPTRRSGPLVS